MSPRRSGHSIAGHDAANRATVKRCRPGEMNVVGLALPDDKKLVDRITKGAACIRSRPRASLLR